VHGGRVRRGARRGVGGDDGLVGGTGGARRGRAGRGRAVTAMTAVTATRGGERRESRPRGRDHAGGAVAVALHREGRREDADENRTGLGR
jgi:hypothetical protein